VLNFTIAVWQTGQPAVQIGPSFVASWTKPKGQDSSLNTTPRVPVPTLERLATYLGYLIDLETSQVETISSTEVEKQTGINAAQFRKDLSYFGEFGKPGVGYNVVDLQNRIARILKIDKDQPVIVLGAGNLGSALVGYPGLREQRFHIVGVFDSNEQKIGKRVWELNVRDIRQLREANAHLGARIAIIAVPASAAQAVAEEAIAAGARALLNFAPIILKVPDRIVVRNVSFLQELAVLSYHLSTDTRK
jgi:redox-sensing transcriptional repressor